MQQEHSKYNKNDKEVWEILFKRQHNNLKDKVCKEYLDCLNSFNT